MKFTDIYLKTLPISKNKTTGLLLLTALFFSSSICSAQNTDQDKQNKTIKKFVEAYNDQNYWRIKKNFFFVGRLLPIKKVMRAVFEPRYAKFGKAKLGTIQFPGKTKAIAEMRYLKDTTEKDFSCTLFQ